MVGRFFFSTNGENWQKVRISMRTLWRPKKNSAAGKKRPDGFNPNIHPITKRMRILSLIALITAFTHRCDAFTFPVAAPQRMRQQACQSSSSKLEVARSFDQNTLLADERYQLPSTHVQDEPIRISNAEALVTKATMLAFIASMCLCLPIALMPISILHDVKVIDRTQSEILSLDAGQFVSKFLLRIMPFARVSVVSDPEDNPEPSIYVCNHTSMLDVFFLLAFDEQLRGKNKRPIKSVYWKGLDNNPICKLLFGMAGFIPVDMDDNGSGNPNQYDKRSFRRLLKDSKRAFEDGFDLLILPEGQLNPWPEQGLLEVFPGAVKLAQISKRRILFVGIHGLHRLWHPDDEIGMTVTGRDVKMRAYPGPGRTFVDGDDFVQVTQSVLGHFGACGEDLPEHELERWLNGSTHDG